MKHFNLKQLGVLAGTLVSVVGVTALPASALAQTKVAASSANTQAKIQTIITRGNDEIVRRLTTLDTLSTKINGAVKLSSTDKSSLNDEVSAEISGLNALKTKLDADTDLPTVQADAQSIFSDYRVYALIVPKVNLVKTADDQQVLEAKLADLATKLQSRITVDQTAGKDVASLQTELNDLTAKTTAAQTTSNSVETSVLALQPSDYNSNHSVLGGYRDQLSTAKGDLQTAITDGKNIASGLKNL